VIEIHRLVDGPAGATTQPANQPLMKFNYDALGRRVETIEYVNAQTGTNLTTPKHTRHIYSGLETVQEYVCDYTSSCPGGFELSAEFFWGDSSRFPEPVAMVWFPSAGQTPTAFPKVFHFLRDALGSIVGLTDRYGNLVERYTYDPYGKTYIEKWDSTANGGAGGWIATNASAFGNPFAWTGQRLDAATGTYHFWGRTYSPVLGRWLQRDPAGYSGGFNLYEYTFGNPEAWIDPLGLEPPSGPPPVPVPGPPGNTWEQKVPSGTGDRGDKWGPKSSIKGQSQPQASWDETNDEWDVDDGLGTRRRYDRHGNEKKGEPHQDRKQNCPQGRSPAPTVNPQPAPSPPSPPNSGPSTTEKAIATVKLAARIVYVSQVKPIVDFLGKIAAAIPPPPLPFPPLVPPQPQPRP
jgi:RHS repeat-associated protein